MCLTIKENQKPKVAAKDITVFKIIQDGYFGKKGLLTFFMYSPIKIGETYHSEIEKNFNQIEIALHSFKRLKDLKAYLMKDYPNRIFIGKKVHIAKCLIPKGSIYYTGDFDNLGKSYASDCVTYVKILK